ncbi:GyrI-like domain-containing protein [Aquirhabdus sp.]|uniref:AraC family transcriptional regulator n=1 Tax=Aquirhabdus sp. TaxID=2824160 RepID=UPI00396CAC08
MTSSSSRLEYEKRMHRVLEYIDQKLDQPLDLHQLAEIAYFSPYHFHRLFAAWMGETLGDYLRRRRVEVAAMRLAAQPHIRILNLALSVGFGSAEAFTRAFKSHFGCAPTTWRTQQHTIRNEYSNPDQMNRKIGQTLATRLTDDEVSTHSEKERIMNVKLIDREPVTIAYLRHLGAYGEPISHFWQDVYVPWAITNNLMNHARYGISHDDPSITAPEQCRYDACAEVDVDYVVTGGAFKTMLAGGKYAALRYKGNGSQIEAAWASLLRDWLPSSGLQLDARPCFEYYPLDASYDPTTGTFECDLCIPVCPL